MSKRKFIVGPAGYIDEISKKDYKYIEGESKK